MILPSKSRSDIFLRSDLKGSSREVGQTKQRRMNVLCKCIAASSSVQCQVQGVKTEQKCNVKLQTAVLNIKSAKVETKKGAFSALRVTRLHLSPSVALSQGRGQLSSSSFSARSMFMRCPTRVTPSSAKSSLVRAGR